MYIENTITRQGKAGRERERGSKEKKGQDRLGRAEPPNVRGDRPDAPCTTVDEHDVKMKNKYGQGTGGGKDGWRQRQLAGCQERVGVRRVWRIVTRP